MAMIEFPSEPMGTGGIIVISAGNSGFKVACGKEVHYVATFEQLTELMDALIVSKGRGKSSRYEIRSSRPIEMEPERKGSDIADRMLQEHGVTP